MRLRYAGFREEGIYNEAGETPAIFHVDIASAGLDAPSDSDLIHSGGIGRSNSLRRPGFYSPSGNVVYAWDISTIGWLLKWALGGYEYTVGSVPAQAEVQVLYLGGATGGTFVLGNGIDVTPPLAFGASATDIDTALETLFDTVDKVTVVVGADFTITFDAAAIGRSGLIAYFGGLTGATDPTLTETVPYLPTLNRHEFFGTDEGVLPSFQAYIGKDVFEHNFHGCCLDNLELAADEGFCLATGDIVAARDTKEALLTVADLLLPTTYPLAFHEVTMRLAGEAATEARVKKMALKIPNGLETGRRLGSRHPIRLTAGARELELTTELYFDSMDELNRFWGAATGPDPLGGSEFAVSIIFDAGDDGILTVACPRAYYATLGTQPSGKDELVQSATIKLLADAITLDDAVTVVNSELLITLDNAITELVHV